MMRSLIRWSVLFVFGIAGAALATVTVMALLGVTVDLSWLRGGVEASAEKALGRDMQIKGPVVLEFSGWPSIEVRDITIANVPQGRAENLLSAGLARLDVRLLSLFKGELNIGEITAEQVTLNLEQDVRGQANWVFGQGKDAAPLSAENPATEAGQPSNDKQPPFSFVGLHELSLQRVTVNYHDAALDRALTFDLDSLHGDAAPGEEVSMHFAGHINADRYALELDGGSLEKLKNPDVSWPFTLTGEVSGRGIDARGELGLRKQMPMLNLVLKVREVDVGTILAQLGLVEGMDATAGEAAIDLAFRGNSLSELVRESRMTFAITDGQWTINDQNTGGSLNISNLAGDILVQGGTAITMKMSGNIEQTPVNFVITGAKLEEYFSSPKQLPLSLDFTMLDSRLTFNAMLALPVSQHNLNFGLRFAGKRLDRFNELLELELPPLGPFSLDARLDVSGKGYELSKLDVGVGESHLEGRMRLDTSRDKPKLDVELLSRLLRVDDFYFGSGGGTDTARGQAQEGDVANQRNETSTQERTAGSDIRELLSFDVLNSLDATIAIEARQVLSGKDALGSGVLKATLVDGRLAVEPLRVDIPGGGVQVGLSLQPRQRDVVMTVNADIDHFDYGILARLVKPETNMNGVMSLDLEIDATAPDRGAIMENANGHFDFALFPGNFSAGVFDLWAISLLNAVATEVDKGEKSVVNCLVVRLGLDSGRMQERVIFMDTTRMTVAGKAEVDFKKREIDILAKPKAKKAEFFSLATPVKVHGSFDDFGLGINPLSLTGSVITFVTSPLHVPVRRVFKKQIPADGKEACEIAWGKTSDEIIREQSEAESSGWMDDPVQE
jgi:uncharacterized protein involved in outer membrane biogenesis